MKNFKRVISAVIALALSASSLVAVSANKFADVHNTNSYAEAIEVLTALGIVHGYEEEGEVIFKPDGEITRAEAATMIVGALNLTKEAQAAAGTTKFTDVNDPSSSWASGYVNVGVAQGFINGMDDTTFAPKENVTYAQMCVMLTLITGYGDYAAAYGGYPTGYTTMAASAGINKGVSLANDANLKRGQVAQMIYNALKAPLLGVKAYNLNGNDYAIQDGGDLAFKTLLSDKFDGYEVDVLIDNTAKSDPALSKGEIKVSQTAAAFLDQSKTKDTSKNFGTVVDEVGVDKYLFISGKAIMTLDDNDKWHLMYFKPNELDKIVLNAADYVTVKNGGKNADALDAATPGNARVTFGSKSFSINANASSVSAVDTATDTYWKGTIYVNGNRYGQLTQANMDKVMQYAQGEVTLIDNVQSGSTVVTSTTGTSTVKQHADGYDLIMVDAYDVVRVDAVTHANGKTSIQVSRKPGDGLNKNVNTIKLSDDAIEDGDIALTVKNAAGESVALSSIKKGDIIAYSSAVPVATAATFPSYIEDPDVIDIIVTDEKVSGMATREDTTDETYTIGDTVYGTVVFGDPNLTIGTTYTIQLDPFGRIYDYADIEAIAERYAIAEGYNDADGLKVILPDGSVKYYEVSASSVTNQNTNLTATTAANSATNIQIAPTATTITPAEFGAFLNQTTKPAVENRVIKYTIKSSTGKMNSITIANPTYTYTGGATNKAEYKDSTGKLGNYTISPSTEAVHYVSSTDHAKFAVSSFKDKEEYTGSVFTDANNANTVAFVVIKTVGTDINGESRFAVVRKRAAQTQVNGDTVLSVNVLYEGEEKDMLFSTTSGAGSTGATGLKEGDAFFFKTDEDGLVSSYIKVLSASARIPANPNTTPPTPAIPATITNNSNLATLASGSNIAATSGGEQFSYNPGKWQFNIGTSGSGVEYQLVYGIITNVTSRGVEFSVSGVETPSPAGTDTDGDGHDDNCWDLDGNGTLDDFDIATGYDKNSNASADQFIDTRSAGKTYSYGLKSDCVNYRYAVNESPSTPHMSIGVGFPTASTISGYLVNRNSGIYNLTGSSDFNGIEHLTYALALVVNGDIAEIYTIVQ